MNCLLHPKANFHRCIFRALSAVQLKRCSPKNEVTSFTNGLFECTEQLRSKHTRGKPPFSEQKFGKSKDISSEFIRAKTKPKDISSEILRNKNKEVTTDSKDISSLFSPVTVEATPNPDDINVGEELGQKLQKDDILRLANQFAKRPAIKLLSHEAGLDIKLFQQAFTSFRRFCLETEALPVDLHLIFSDLLQGSGHIDDLFPYFMNHAKQVFPHLECMDELRKISDSRSPANWYPEARALNRKIIFHAGPTNSGKTYHALERFMGAKTGCYCGPLKLLAVEVFTKTNDKGTFCDLVTGEEQRCVQGENMKSEHVACTVEMTSVNTPFEVVVIDEIQMIKDQSRGWAWTRALLGVAAQEVHLCGEEAALDLVKELVSSVGEEVEVCRYNRLTSLTIADEALISLKNIRPGDCIVCFNKNDIYTVSLQIEKIGMECAVIYGGLPPGTKVAQAQKFNDPNHPCKVLVATDAIGMGLNLSIQRVIFYSLMKPFVNERGEKEIDTISTSQALQIAGRAGRYGTQFSEGLVTTYKPEDLPVLKNIMSQIVEPITMAGIQPTADQIELFAYYLPHATLSNLVDIFVSLCRLDQSHYFMCNVDDFKFLADMIQHVPLPLRARYVFCCAPINRKLPFVCSMFLRMSRQYSQNEAITFDWLCRGVGFPFSPPRNIMDLVHLEAIFDVLDLYLWLSYRFQDLFPDSRIVRDNQKELDATIQLGVLNITQLLKNSESEKASAVIKARDENFLIKHQRNDYFQTKNEDFLADGNYSEIRAQHDSAMGSLASRLIEQGLLTPKMLEQLRKELTGKDKKDVEQSNQRNKKTPVK